jgi:hypothetical protein
MTFDGVSEYLHFSPRRVYQISTSTALVEGAEARAPLPAAVKHSGDRDSDCRAGGNAGLRCVGKEVSREKNMKP